MRPFTTKKSGETARYFRGCKQYFAGAKSFMKRQLAKCRRRYEADKIRKEI